MSTKLYVGNLSFDTSRDDLYNLFAKYGNVEDAFIPTDRETGRARGFGFVTLEAAGATQAMEELNGTEFMGRTVRVNEASPPGDRGGGGGYGGGGGGRGGGGGGFGGGGGYQQGGGGGGYGGQQGGGGGGYGGGQRQGGGGGGQW
ncbi:hypothetical protein FOA52_013343 [Chlamydomonas sp. UWO 241]|nr:hypothetical protein FOA52_013343 [Chlamydomonas sp. UWO 241]